MSSIEVNVNGRAIKTFQTFQYWEKSGLRVNVKNKGQIHKEGKMEIKKTGEIRNLIDNIIIHSIIENFSLSYEPTLISCIF